MFGGFSEEAFEFLFGIRLNNNREWFEPNKKIYVEKVYEPLKALAEDIFKPFESSGMICKTGRIYRDEHFPPYLHYRDTLYIYVRRNAVYWNKTPTLYFEIFPEGTEFGFRISKPEAAVMEIFRNRLTADPKPFLKLADELKKHGITFGGDEYKRKKKCEIPEAEEFFIKKGLSAYVQVTDRKELSSPALAGRIIEIFKAVMPLYEMFYEFVTESEAVKTAEKEAAVKEDIPELIKAPPIDFMW